MNFKTYCTRARKTAHYKLKRGYPALGLAAEAGEVANLVKKLYRTELGSSESDIRNRVADELGDVLWYTAMVARDFNLDLTTIAESNLSKLQRRYR